MRSMVSTKPSSVVSLHNHYNKSIYVSFQQNTSRMLWFFSKTYKTLIGTLYIWHWEHSLMNAVFIALEFHTLFLGRSIKQREIKHSTNNSTIASCKLPWPSFSMLAEIWWNSSYFNLLNSSASSSHQSKRSYFKLYFIYLLRPVEQAASLC